MQQSAPETRLWALLPVKLLHHSVYRCHHPLFVQCRCVQGRCREAYRAAWPAWREGGTGYTTTSLLPPAERKDLCAESPSLLLEQGEGSARRDCLRENKVEY